MQIISLKMFVEIQQIVFHVTTPTLIVRDKLSTVLRYHEHQRESLSDGPQTRFSFFCYGASSIVWGPEVGILFDTDC